MNMPAILILLGQIIFGFFFGFLGLMLAVPLSACFAVLVDEMYCEGYSGRSGQVNGGRGSACRRCDNGRSSAGANLT